MNYMAAAFVGKLMVAFFVGRHIATLFVGKHMAAAKAETMDESTKRRNNG